MRSSNFKITRCLFAVAFLLLPFVASAAANFLNGVAVHTELGKDQFVGGLFVSTVSSDARSVILANEDKRIEVRVIPKRLSSRRFKRMWIEGMAINASPDELARHAQHMADFSNMLKIKLTSGDTYAVTRGAKTVEVSLNGAKLGEIPDPSFFDLLLRTWIGPVPLSSTFRSELLANGSPNGATLALFNSTEPSEDRINAVAGAVSQLAEELPNKADIAAIAKPELDKPKLELPKVTAPASPVAEPAKPTAPVVASVPYVDTPAKPDTPDVVVSEEPTVLPPLEEPTVLPPLDVPPKTTDVAAISQPVRDESLTALLEDDEAEEDTPFTAESLLAQTLYIAKLKRWSHQYLRYPPRAESRGQEGNVRMNITINRQGKVKNLEVIEAAEFKSLTKEATRAVKRANPFPAMPADLPGEEFVFTLPVVFKLAR